MKKVKNPEKRWGKPMIKTCGNCTHNYEYYRSGDYPGKSPSLCPTCQIEYEERRTNFGTSGSPITRSMGHRTRQQHKKFGGY